MILKISGQFESVVISLIFLDPKTDQFFRMFPLQTNRRALRKCDYIIQKPAEFEVGGE